MTSRVPNHILCSQFRDLLTKNFYIVDDDGEIHSEGEQHERGLIATKPWRNDIWKAFRELENRLCPLEKIARERK